MAVVALTQAQKDTLKLDPAFKKYFVDNIYGDDFGGIGFLLRLSSFVTIPQAIAFITARAIQSRPEIVENDTNLLTFMMTRMTVRDIDRLENAGGGTLYDQVTAYLNASNRINLLIEDYFAEKGKGY